MAHDPITSRDASSLLHEVPDAVLVVDRSERVLVANAAAAHMFGADGGVLVGMQLAELLPAAARHHHGALVAEYFKNPTARPMGSGRALAARRYDGTEVPVEIALAPSTFHGRPVVIAVLRDRSAQAAAERARLEAEERAARAHAQLDRADESIVLLDPAGRISHVNAAWTRLARGNGADDALAKGVGLDYLEACRTDPDAEPVVCALQGAPT
jgi:PAS domain S-box-containing protein